MTPGDDLLSEYFRQQKLDDEEEEECGPSWKDKPPHGLYHRVAE